MSDACFISSSISECQGVRQAVVFNILPDGPQQNNSTEHQSGYCVFTQLPAPTSHTSLPMLISCSNTFQARYHILSPDPETQCNSFWPFLYFFMNTLKHHMFSVLCGKEKENYRCHSVQTLPFCSTIAVDMLEVTVQVRRSVTEQKAGGSILGYKPQVVLQCVHRSVSVGQIALQYRRKCSYE